MDKKTGHPQAARNTHGNFNDTSAANQRGIILAALRTCPQTTVELRHGHGIMQPAPRIFELRGQGHDIVTVRTVTYTPDGIKHHAVAKYVLRGECHA